MMRHATMAVPLFLNVHARHTAQPITAPPAGPESEKLATKHLICAGFAWHNLINALSGRIIQVS